MELSRQDHPGGFSAGKALDAEIPFPRESRPPEPFAVTKLITSQLVRKVRTAGVGVAVFATDSTRHLVFAADGVSEHLTNCSSSSGSCLDAYLFHSPQRHDNMAEGEAFTRCPLFAVESLSAGAASLDARALDAEGPVRGA